MPHPLQARIETVSNATADAERLVTLAVPPDEPVGAAREQVAAERAAVEDDPDAPSALDEALDAVRRRLDEYDETPENGLVLYAGVVDGEHVEQAFDDLPSPVPESRFEAADAFAVEPLESATSRTDSTAFGLLVVERERAVLGRLADDRIETVASLDGEAPGKAPAIGVSHDRFERDADGQSAAFFETVAAHVERAFMEDPGEAEVASDRDSSRSEADESAGDAAPDLSDTGAAGTGDGRSTGDATEHGSEPDLSVEGLLLGGTTVALEAFLDGEHLDRRLRDAVVDSYTVEYATEQGLRELVQRAGADVGAARRADARDVLETFYDSMEDDDVVYGRDRTDDALTYDAVETLLVSEELPGELLEDLRERAAGQGGDSVVVSTDAERGRRFHDAFDGVAALLRFPIE